MDELSAQAVLAYLRDQRKAMTDFLRQLVLLESPTLEPARQEPVFELLSGKLREIGFQTRRMSGHQTGGLLLAMPTARQRRRPVQLLVGHCDTVWPVGTLKEMPVVVEDGLMRGPGVYDMKAGLTQMLFALQALQALGLRPAVTPVVLVNSDEEIGSPESARYIGLLARCADRALVLEPSQGLRGKLKTARKGVQRFRVTVHGRAAHAGVAPQEGISAILELSYVIQKLFALNDLESGLTVNVGVVKGGSRPNVVAAEAQAEVDVRAPNQELAGQVERQIMSLRPELAGASLEVTKLRGMPPMERTPRNRRLWERARLLAAQLGLEVEETMSGGGSDGNRTSQFTATLDGLGAVGDGAHARHEFVYLDKMPERAALLALLLLSPPLSSAI